MTKMAIIIHPIVVKIFHSAFFIFLGYFLLLIFYYILLAIIGFVEEKKRTLQSEDEGYPILSASTFTLPVSIIIPARNEEGWIADSLGSVLRLKYPEFEVVVVDDGSTDKTPAILDEMLGLKAHDKTYIKEYRDGQVREIFRSDKYPNVTVISKASGYKKAGALNAGLNVAKYKYICVMDADTVLEPDALLKVMAHVQKDPDRVIGVGSYFGLNNGFKIKEGRILEKSFSYNPLIAYQNLEYIRSFIGNRLAWSRFNVMPIVAGGFGLWRRDVVRDLGGFNKEFTCEDIEFTFRAHDYIVKNERRDYKILMLPYFAGWTEGPSNIRSLMIQRNRWQRVVEETVVKYWYMTFNPRYGGFAFLILPYYIIYEVFGAFFEIISIFMTLLGLALGMLNVKLLLAIFGLMILSQGLISSLSLLAFLRGQRLFTLRYVLYLMILGFLEFFWYRWLIAFAKISGTYSYSKGMREPTQYQRAKRV